MTHPPTTPDVRFVPITDQHIRDIRHGDETAILNAIAYIVHAYDTAPPMTHISALSYMRDVQWWRHTTSDLDNA